MVGSQQIAHFMLAPVKYAFTWLSFKFSFVFVDRDLFDVFNITTSSK